MDFDDNENLDDATENDLPPADEPRLPGRPLDERSTGATDPFDDFDDDDFDDEFDDDFEEEWDEELPGDADQFPADDPVETDDDVEFEPEIEEDE